MASEVRAMRTKGLALAWKTEIAVSMSSALARSGLDAIVLRYRLTNGVMTRFCWSATIMERRTKRR